MSRLQSILLTQPWALHEGWLPLLVDIVERRLEMGIKFDQAAKALLGSYTPELVEMQPIDSAIDAADAPKGYSVFFGVEQTAIEGDDGFLTIQQKGGEIFAAPTSASATPAEGQKIAVLNVMGPISQYPSMEMSGPASASTEGISKAFSAQLGDPSVRAIVMNIDSPGGGVYGVQELANQIMAARGQKPIIAQVSSLAASAAYWIASACDEIVVTPSGQVGSIGVYTLHQDVSQAMDKAGVKPTFISAGKYKVEGNQFAQLDPDAAGAMQDTVNGYYKDFTGSVAKGRGTTVDAVKNGYGEGRVLKADAAVKAGMADRVATLQQTLKRLGSTRGAEVTKAQTMGELETAALAHVPLVEHPGPAVATSLMINQQMDEATGVKTLRVIGSEWPATIAFSSGILSLPEHMGSFLTIGAGKLSIDVANGAAMYRITGRTNDDCLVCELQTGTLEAFYPEDALAPESPVSADPEAAEASDWRRRKHLHRMRHA